MKGYKANIESITLENENFRHVLYTANHVQLVAMSLKPGEAIGLEVHDVDQFFRIEKGIGTVIINGITQSVGDGDVVIVPADAEHNVINTSDAASLKLYTIYCPPHHKDRTVHATKEQAMNDEEHFDGKTTE